MEYREIVAVTGLGGLFQLLTTKSDGAIVRSLTDKAVKFIPARIHNVTPIESIEVYAVEENVRLHKVLQMMKDNEATNPLVDTKKADNGAIKTYFKTVFPDIDEDRVYVSDMKKILKWYEILKDNNLLDFSFYDQAEQESEQNTAATAEEAPTEEPVAAEEPAEAEKPAKKARAKKAAPATSEVEGEEKPAKKTARKKKTEE